MTFRWATTHIRWFAAGALAAGALAVPSAARAGIFDIFGGITSEITGNIGKSLTLVNGIQKAASSLQQDVLAPLALINQTRGYINQVQNAYRGWMSGVFHLQGNSAQLPSSQSLESAFLGGQTGSLGQMSGLYKTTFGALPSAAAAPQAHRQMIDMDDAMAQDALATSVAADESTSEVLVLSAQIEDESSTTAPGTADIVSATARAAELQSLATQHKLFAAMLREEAAHLAHRNGIKKQNVLDTQGFSTNLSGAVSR